MRALVVINPHATTTSSHTRNVLLSALSNVLDLDVVETTHRGHACELARMARGDGIDLVVAVGGDGTINEVVNGLLGETTYPHLPDVAIIPGGSTNVLARNLGLPENSVDATGLLLDALRTGRRRTIGLGRLDDRYFTFAAGFGFDADVIHAVENERAHGGQATLPLYARTAVRRFFAQRNRGHGSIDLLVDDEPPIGGLRVVIVTNCSPWTYIGGRPLRPTPRADFNTGLDVFALRSLRLAPTLWRLAQMTSQRGPHGRHVVVLHDHHHLTLTAPHPLPAQVDGDFIGEWEQLNLTSVPEALQLVY
jgi:diacylglycerol kinase family enzyme